MPITMLNMIRKNIYEYVGAEQSERKLLKIYVKRKGGRNILNSRKIEKLLFEEGFIFISPEDYDMEMQVRLFRRASHVVAATGAALTNLLWVKTNSKILVMLSDNKLHQPSIWEDFARISSSEITLLYGEREFANDDYGGIHDNFHIDLKKVTEWLSINQAAEQ